MFDTKMIPNDEVHFDLLPVDGMVRPEPEGNPPVADAKWLPSGVMLAAALDRIDRERLSGFDRVSLLEARARQIS
jgi:hypothetical protein